eukprot:PITA_01569
MFKRQFAHLEEHYSKGENSTPLGRQHASLPRERVIEFRDNPTKHSKDSEKQQERITASVTKATLQSPPRNQGIVIDSAVSLSNGPSRAVPDPRNLVKSASINASKCTVVVNSCQRRNSTMKPGDEKKEDLSSESSAVTYNTDSMVAGLTSKIAAMSSGVAHS